MQIDRVLKPLQTNHYNDRKTTIFNNFSISTNKNARCNGSQLSLLN